MRVAKIENCAMAEFTDAITCVIFLQGCDLDCSFCQNPQLIPRFEGGENMSWQQVSLKIQWNYIDWLSFTGGEPLEQEDQDGICKLSMMALQFGKRVNLDMNSNLTPIKMKDLQYIGQFLSSVSVDIKSFRNIHKLLEDLRRIDVLRKCRFRTVVLDDKSVPLSPHTASLLLGYGVRSIRMLSNSKQGRGANLPETNPAVLGAIHNYYNKYGVDFVDAERKV